MRKLAITISGAVSLGSYEAGVLYEVFQALKAHNTTCDREDLPNEKIWIDVVTGASAGGMSAAIAVQKLLFDATALDGANTNALYLPWVKEISLQRLLATDSKATEQTSILNSDVIEQIARKYLLQRYTSSPSSATPHPAAAKIIHLGLAMSNMNGVDYAIPISSGEFIYTRFADELTRSITGAPCDTLKYWQELLPAILACGAFPFAFRPRQVLRNGRDYTRPNVLKASLPPDPLHFAYVDGGVFQNEPLGLAKNLVETLETADPSAAGADRTYLYIAPSIRQTESDFGFRADAADYLKLARRMVTSIFNQSRFQDWINTERINVKVRQRHSSIAKAFENAIDSGEMWAEQLRLVSHTLAPKKHAAVTAEANPTGLLKAKKYGLEDAYRRLARPEILGTSGAAAWIDAVAATRDVAAPYDLMHVDAIIAKPEELCGSALEGFAGFFAESYRRHDYDMGRLKAQEMLSKGNSYLGSLREYVPTPIDPPPSQRPEITPSKLSRGLRIKLRDRLRQAIRQLLAQSGQTNSLERWGGDAFIVKGLLNRWLGL